MLVAEKKRKDGHVADTNPSASGHALDSPFSAIITGIFQGVSVRTFPAPIFIVLLTSKGGGHLIGMLPALALSFGEVVVFLVAFALAMAVSMALFALVVGEVQRKKDN